MFIVKFKFKIINIYYPTTLTKLFYSLRNNGRPKTSNNFYRNKKHQC